MLTNIRWKLKVGGHFNIQDKTLPVYDSKEYRYDSLTVI